MAKEFLHLICCPFTGLGLQNGFRGNEWFSYRISIFKQYPLKSLLSQTEKDFVLWVCFREQERENPITKQFYEDLNKTGLKFIFTFGGIPMYDDKYKFDNLQERLQIILPQLKDVYNGEKYIYETLQPSDDFYHPKEIEEIQAQTYKERRILTHGRGYVFNTKTQRLGLWNPRTARHQTCNPPFYTIMYPADVFFDPDKHIRYMRNSISHEDVVWIFDPVRLNNYRYCVLIHGNQISTSWYHPYREGQFPWEYGKDIMKEWGFDIEIGEPQEIKYGLIEIKGVIKYWIYTFLIKGRLYRILKTLKNKHIDGKQKKEKGILPAADRQN